MLKHCSLLIAGALLSLTVSSDAFLHGAIAQTAALPAEISDSEFWRIITEFSEPDGAYRADNWISNEASIQNVIPALKRVVKPGGAYLGVGPEQNFTYAWAFQPKIAFVIDIRRQNMLELLMQKALFELSPDRVDFAFRLFSRKRPAGLDARMPAAALFAAIEAAPRDDLSKNMLAYKEVFTKRGYKLSPEDLVTIDRVYLIFSQGGPSITAEFASPGSPVGIPVTYTQHMTSTDANRTNWSFLGTEEAYQYIREMQRKNLIVPLVGDFAGPKAIRQVGQYLKQHNARVGVYYASNVEFFLTGQKLQDFLGNVDALPIDDTSMFIRWVAIPSIPFVPWYNQSMGPVLTMAASMTEMMTRFKAGTSPTTWEATLRESKDTEVVVRQIQDPSLRRVSGRVTGGPPLSANELLRVQLLEMPLGAGLILSTDVGPDGSFEFRNVQPKTYQVIVVRTCRGCDYANGVGAGSAVVVADKDITGMQLTARSR